MCRGGGTLTLALALMPRALTECPGVALGSNSTGHSRSYKKPSTGSMDDANSPIRTPTLSLLSLVSLLGDGSKSARINAAGRP